MDPERRKRLSRATGHDIDQTWTDFQVSTGGEDEGAFLDYLHQHELIDTQTWSEAQSNQPVTLVEVPASAAGERYQRIAVVGEGAMGAVYVARDTELRRRVAVKELRGVAVGLHGRRFLAEVQITAQLDHPYIVPVYGLEQGQAGGLSYAMKLVQGHTLGELLAQAREAPRPFSRGAIERRLEAFIKVCDAIAYAHSRGVLHRDLKPANVMVGQHHEIYVMDWGIARLLVGAERDPDPTSTLDLSDPDSTQRTRMGTVVGTPAYMSPEQAAGRVSELGPSSDVFALGLLLYELVTLRRAYRADNVGEVLEMARTARLAPIHEPVSSELVAIIQRATALHSAERYPSAAALAEDLRRWLRDEPTEALPDDALRRLRRWVSHHSQLMLTAFVLVLAMGPALLALLQARHQVSLSRQAAAARVEERASTALLARTAARAAEIDNHFLWYEGLLEGLSAAATYALTSGTALPGPAWDSQAYKSPATAPPDLVFSKHYNRPISTTWPVFHTPPGADPGRWRPQLDRLQGLRPYLRKMLLSSPHGGPPPATPSAEVARLTGADVPMEWAYVALEDSGLMVMFPGAAGWEPSYDPRTRPWYREARGNRGRSWGTPYVDLMGQGRLISCLQVLRDGQGRMLGMAGVDLELGYLIRRYLSDDSEDFVAAYLIDDDGRILLASTVADQRYTVPATEALDDGLDFGRFEQAAVLASVAEGGSGTLRDGAQRLAWSRLHHVGWTLVLVTR